MRGWLQESWPKSMAELCPGLAAGVPVDERQTGTTLGDLRRQTPDAPLRGLAEPLPGERVVRCEHREESASRPCASGRGRMVDFKVYAGRCGEWGTKTVWGGGRLVRTETDDSACKRAGK